MQDTTRQLVTETVVAVADMAAKAVREAEDGGITGRVVVFEAEHPSMAQLALPHGAEAEMLPEAEMLAWVHAADDALAQMRVPCGDGASGAWWFAWEGDRVVAFHPSYDQN
jgi:hypothetical protein